MTEHPSEHSFIYNKRRMLFVEPKSHNSIPSSNDLGPGFSDIDLLEWLTSKYIPKGDFIDIGAGTGNYTLFFSAIMGRHVRAFEPRQDSFNALNINLQLNKCEGVNLFQFSLGLHNTKSVDEGSVSLDVPAEYANTIERRLGDTELDSVESISLIKIDDAGGEVDVIRGCRDTITTHKPLLLVRCRDIDGARVLVDSMAELQYTPQAVFGTEPVVVFEYNNKAPDQTNQAATQMLESYFNLKAAYAVDYKTRTKWHWKQIRLLEAEVKRLKSSVSYRAGLVSTLPFRSLFRHDVIGSPLRGIYAMLHADKKLVMENRELTHGDLYRSPSKKTFTSRKTPGSMRMAVIMDDFTFSSFEPECETLQLTPGSWIKEINDFKPDILFVESAWRGKDSAWTGKIHPCADELVELVAYCQGHSIPTAFWNKEDPAHTITFMRTASLFDYVFTTDLNTISIYREVFGHNRIFLLPFASQPKIHNPIEIYERQDKFNFAGSYYSKYKERCRDFKAIVEAVTTVKELDIYDRNYDNDIELFRFAPEYTPFIKGKLPYSEIDKAYKGYRYAITMNTIKHSPTMFARRAFELLASNTITVGNHSDGIKNILGDLTISSDNTQDIIKKLDRVSGSDNYENKFKLLGLRKVLGEHNYQERLARIFSKVFFNYSETSQGAGQVCVVAFVQSQEDLGAVVDSYNLQMYDSKRLIIIAKHEGITHPGDIEATVILQKDISRKTMQDVLTDDQYIAVFSPDCYYGPHYISDIMLATTYSDATAIGKCAHYEVGAEGGLSVRNKHKQYRVDQEVKLYASIIRSQLLVKCKVSDFIDGMNSMAYTDDTLALDEFNYCESRDISDEQKREVDGQLDIDTGIDIEDLYQMADAISNNKLQSIKSSYRKKMRLVRTLPPQKPL